jgi:hypothetical protein
MYVFSYKMISPDIDWVFRVYLGIHIKKTYSQAPAMTAYWSCTQPIYSLSSFRPSSYSWDLRAGNTPVHRYQVYGGVNDARKEVLSVAYSPSVENLLLTGGGDSASRLNLDKLSING